MRGNGNSDSAHDDGSYPRLLAGLIILARSTAQRPDNEDASPRILIWQFIGVLLALVLMDASVPNWLSTAVAAALPIVAILNRGRKAQSWLGGLTAPPRGFWTDLLLPPERADDILYNLLGRCDYWVQKHGAVKARLIFATQSFGCILSFWTDWLLRRVRLLVQLRKQ